MYNITLIINELWFLTKSHQKFKENNCQVLTTIETQQNRKIGSKLLLKNNSIVNLYSTNEKSLKILVLE